MSAMFAARFPPKVASLVLAGAPIDTDAGEGPIKIMAHSYPMSLYEDLVAQGGGLMLGRFMLAGCKGMHPEEQYVQKHIDLYEHIDDPAYLAKTETFESWYENALDLSGRWYLQLIKPIFKENQLAKGESMTASGAQLSNPLPLAACKRSSSDLDRTLAAHSTARESAISTPPTCAGWRRLQRCWSRPNAPPARRRACARCRGCGSRSFGRWARRP